MECKWNGDVAIIEAARAGNSIAIKHLIAHGANIDAENVSAWVLRCEILSGVIDSAGYNHVDTVNVHVHTHIDSHT